MSYDVNREREKKNSDDAENNTAFASAGSKNVFVADELTRVAYAPLKLRPNGAVKIYYYFFTLRTPFPKLTKQYKDRQSVQSAAGKLSCNKTALKRCTKTEILIIIIVIFLIPQYSIPDGKKTKQGVNDCNGGLLGRKSAKE